jgi:hypothetical protein
MGEKSNGQRMLEAWESWIGSWLAFSPEPMNQALILALWAMHTWFAPSFPATSYLFLTSAGPGCGKTTLLEVLASLSLRPRKRATLRALAVVRDIEENAGATSYFFDQVEALSAVKISDEQAILLTGYKRGGEHGISVGQKQVAFSTYCAKCFAAIGTIARDLESRCLVCKLGYGVPTRSWTDEVMTREDEAKAMLHALGVVLPSAAAVKWVPPSFLAGREREIGTPIWSVALALGLDGATMARVQEGLVSWFGWKVEAAANGEQKSYRDMLSGAEVQRDARREAEKQALRDLAAVLPVADARHTGHVASVRAVELMREYNGAWVRFGGMGLDAMALSALVKPFGLAVDVVRLTKGAGKQVKGYRADKVRKALALLGEG